MTRPYLAEDDVPTREEVDAITGPLLVEFGTAWCGYCQAAQRDIVDLLAKHPDVRHVKVEDGPGRRLGRSFRVKLWPNLVFMRDGVVVRQLARPSAGEMREAFQALAAGVTAGAGAPSSGNPSDRAT